MNCRLSKLSITKCKRFKEKTEFNFIFPLTVLVGQNGSGKTTVARAIKLLKPNYGPQCEFFETEIDNGGFANAKFDYIVDGHELAYQHTEKPRKWNLEGTLPQRVSITSIQTKSFVGGIEKSFLYDNIAKSAKREDQVDYVQRQAHKIQQKPQEGSRKLRCSLTENELSVVNRILDSCFQSIEIIRHKFFCGTWATNILFQNKNDFCEYNSGSGEFLVATIVREVEKAPNNSIVLIDEPEISLHPRAQYRLVEYFFDAIKRKHIQMIVTTHSEHIVEKLPKEAIICLRKNENKTYVQQNVIPEFAFLEIGSPILNRKRIIVEDEMAKSIVEEVLEEEKLNGIISVEFYPGGCSNLKKYTILTFARTNIKSQYILFDGDQFNEAVPDFDSILERDKTISYYRDCFQRIVGIRNSTMDWGLDSNPAEGRLNEKQEKSQIEKYLLFYKNNVFFLPKVIPEDIIYNEEYLRIICGQQKFPSFNGARDSKEKLFRIASSLGISIGNIEQLLVRQFIIKKEEDYQTIARLVRMIAEQ
ncbi:ATP-dependent nuclease [Blautia sp. SF-50]|uniref:ATP-dependent nuclease n=1 Tax=Blautia sp. SF-50 TaxID=1520805 RepID=UPI002E8DE479|nr:AAA family ATPase [Blautia sp. SF-50]